MKIALLVLALLTTVVAEAYPTSSRPAERIYLSCKLGNNPIRYPADGGPEVNIQLNAMEERAAFTQGNYEYRVRAFFPEICQSKELRKIWVTLSIVHLPGGQPYASASGYLSGALGDEVDLNPPLPGRGFACIVIKGAQCR